MVICHVRWLTELAPQYYDFKGKYAPAKPAQSAASSASVVDTASAAQGASLPAPTVSTGQEAAVLGRNVDPSAKIAIE